MNAQSRKDQLVPEIERYIQMIADMKLSIAQNDTSLEKEAEKTAELNERITVLTGKKDKKREEFDKLQSDYIKEKDEPVRLGKGNENLRIAVEHLRTDLDGLRKDTEQAQASLKKENDIHINLITQKARFDEDGNEKKKLQRKIAGETDQLKHLFNTTENNNKDISANRYLIDQETETIQRRHKQLTKDLNGYNKKINDVQYGIKKTEHQNAGIVANYKDLKTQTEVMEKLAEEKKKAQKQLKKDQDKLIEEQHISVGVLVKRGLEDKTMEAKKSKLLEDISAHKNQVNEFQEEENKWVEEIKFLSTIREKMARTASQAMAQARETKEELKVKELLILDLTKKQQETEFRLSAFIALYEEVKNARNKYVSQIQNSSQDLAEMKERIKIL